MPYFIYKISDRPIRMLHKLEQFEKYREASSCVKLLRSEMAESATYSIKMFFAENELHAEDMLNEVREVQPELGDD
ncbi:MAG: hypothetical protein A2342_03700 [Gallionellales bacterium RIFOXYB12_FULL_54_9]|nr:MAG: hypothetical protein A2342_03700 [Gallionellales bacterium RIFOXYB12_FULL_54_9]